MFLTNRFSLNRVGALPPNTLRIDYHDETAIQLTALDHLPSVRLEAFLLDKFEVSNRQFKEFVDRGGYSTTGHWKHPFVKGGKTLTWAEAMTEFRDSTGRPGPATWKNGTFPEEEADFPVSGVSWYEASAYAEFLGKRLPSIYHWSLAANPWQGEFIVPLSNFVGHGPARVGSYQGMSWCGAYDLAGNAKEWCSNEARPGTRYILGGGWKEPDYMSSDPDAQPPMDRLATFGFRCICLLSTNAMPEGVDDPVAPAFRNYAKEQPVSDQTFRVYRGLFTYDKTELNARTEAIDDTPALWRKETVSFAAAYGSERVTACVFLPKKSNPPFQAVVNFPGAGAIFARSSREMTLGDREAAILEQGRALIYPIYKGTYERADGLRTDCPASTSFFRDHVIQWAKDLGRTIDYLETRSDIRRDKLAYCGGSWGAALGAILPAIETRFHASILSGGGFYMQPTLPEVDQLNFAPHVTVPTLMINGRYDFFFPVESSQKPMFQLLGPSPGHKRHVIIECGHAPPKAPVSREIQAWLDRYLGPVK